VPVTVVPAAALAGNAMVVLTLVNTTAMVAVALLLPSVGSAVPTGGVTLATLARLPVAPRATLTWKVTVALAPLAKVLLPEMVLPTAAALMPALVTMLLMVPRPAGKVSIQLAPTTALGPLLTMTMV
jgi:hypothetical protein